MKVLVADQFEQSGLDGLAAIGCDVVYDPALKDEALAAALRETQAEVLVVRSTKVTEAIMDAGDLALIVRAGAGYNTIDVAAASARGIYVSNCPGRNAVAVAELAFGLILALDRRIPDNVADLRAGRWNKQEYAKAAACRARRSGCSGSATIAQELARRAQAFGCDLVIWARRFDATTARPDVGAARRHGLERPGGGVAIARRPARSRPGRHPQRAPGAPAAETRGLVDADLLGRLRPGAHVHQHRPGRGGRLRRRWPRPCGSGRSGSGSTSTRTSRPPGPRTSTSRSSTCPASTGRTTSARRRSRRRRRSPPRWSASSGPFAETGRVPNVVNLARRTPATHVLVIRHRDRPGVLAHVFEPLRQGINVQETENIVFEGAEAAIARINMDGPVSDDELGVDARGEPEHHQPSAGRSVTRSGPRVNRGRGSQPDQGSVAAT